MKKLMYNLDLLEVKIMNFLDFDNFLKFKELGFYLRNIDISNTSLKELYDLDTNYIICNSIDIIKAKNYKSNIINSLNYINFYLLEINKIFISNKINLFNERIDILLDTVKDILLKKSNEIHSINRYYSRLECIDLMCDNCHTNQNQEIQTSRIIDDDFQCEFCYSHNVRKTFE